MTKELRYQEKVSNSEQNTIQVVTTSKYISQFVHKGMLSMNSAISQLGPSINRNLKLNDTVTTDITHNNLSYSAVHSGSQGLIEHLELKSFKIHQCNKMNNPHSHKHCPFFHNNKDRKRNGTFYSTELCQYLEANQICPFGDNCNKAHNRVEQLYRPDNYKTKFCTFYPNSIANCEYGKFCSFAHSEEDISIELIHNLEYDDDFFMFYYKTIWCPFNLTQHDKALCVYAHNWQDFRRNPHIFQYQPISCQNWKTNSFITEYSDGCPDAFGCTKCHGWKELEYHQILFRTKQCLNQHCSKLDCSFYHFASDKRNIVQLTQCRVFKIVPRNRILKNTFKVRGTTNMNSQQSHLFSSEARVKPMYLSQQQTESKGYQVNYFTSDNNDWLGTHNLQNTSMMLDVESKGETENEKKNKTFQTLLVTIQEKTDHDELMELKRKRSYSMTIKDEQHPEELDNGRSMIF